MTPAQLIKLKQEQEAISLQIARAEKGMLAEMLANGTEQYKAAGGSITLQYRSSKARDKSEAELELIQAIADEQGEMASNNAREIYALQKQAYLATMKAEALLHTPWQGELRAKLLLAEQERKAGREARPVLCYELPQPELSELCCAEDYAEIAAMAAGASPKRFTKYATLCWLKANSHLQGAELISAFSERMKEHSEYWSKH